MTQKHNFKRQYSALSMTSQSLLFRMNGHCNGRDDVLQWTAVKMHQYKIITGFSRVRMRSKQSIRRAKLPEN